MKNSFYIFLITVVTVIFFVKLFYPKPAIFFTPETTKGDIWYFNYPVRNFLGNSLKNIKLPLWIRDMGTGYPIYAEGQIGTFNIFNLMFFSLFPNWLAFNLSYITIFFLNFLGYFLFFKIQKIRFSAGTIVVLVIFFVYFQILPCIKGVKFDR